MFEVETRTVAGRPAAVGWAGPHTLVVDRPADGGGDGIGFNGGELLYLWRWRAACRTTSIGRRTGWGSRSSGDWIGEIPNSLRGGTAVTLGRVEVGP